MTFGVKVIQTYIVDNDKHFYEELILKVEAKNPDEAYEKAEAYMKDADFEYTNIYGQTVKTLKIEAIDCFMAYEDEEVQEVYSTFLINRTSLTDKEFYDAITLDCEPTDLYPLRNKEFN